MANSVREVTSREYVALIQNLPREVRFRVGVISKGGDAHPDEDGEDSGLTIAEVLEIHEFGKGNCPPRSVIRGWFDENVDEIRRLLVTQFTQVKNTSAVVIAQRLALKFRAGMQIRITQRIPPPLKASTVKRKTRRGKKDVPLIDTGILRSSLEADSEVIP